MGAAYQIHPQQLEKLFACRWKQDRVIQTPIQTANKPPHCRWKSYVCNEWKKCPVALADADMINLAFCSHEKVDTHFLLHVHDLPDLHTKRVGKVCICTVDTNVVVLAIAMFNRIKPNELWMALGTGPNFWGIPIHELAAAMERITGLVPFSLCFMH